MKIVYKDYAELINLFQIKELIQQQINIVNDELASYETIKKFMIHEGHLTIEAGFLTPSLKLKRNQVYEMFQQQLDKFYDVETDCHL